MIIQTNCVFSGSIFCLLKEIQVLNHFDGLFFFKSKVVMVTLPF